MDWRSFSRAICGAIGALALAGVLAAPVVVSSGCGRYAVRASEKEHLADRTMRFDHDRQETESDQHILNNREGSTGGRGTGGGGCGCN